MRMCLACFKDKMDTNTFAAVAYLPNLARHGNTQDFVSPVSRILPLSSSLAASRQPETTTAWVVYL